VGAVNSIWCKNQDKLFATPIIQKPRGQFRAVRQLATPSDSTWCWPSKKREKHGLLARLGTIAIEPCGNTCAKIDDNLKNRTRLTGWLNKAPESERTPFPLSGVLHVSRQSVGAKNKSEELKVK